MKDKKLPSNIPDHGPSTFSSFDPSIDEHEAVFPGVYPSPPIDNQKTDFAYYGGAFSLEEKKEFLVITRSSVEVLSSMLNAETQEKPVKVCISLLHFYVHILINFQQIKVGRKVRISPT